MAKRAAKTHSDMTTAPTSEGTMSKANAIRAALEAGVNSPSAAVGFINKKFGVDVSRAHFSAFKSQAKKADASHLKKSVQSTKAAKLPQTNADVDLLGTLEALKPLVAALGVDKVKRLAELLG